METAPPRRTEPATNPKLAIALTLPSAVQLKCHDADEPLAHSLCGDRNGLLERSHQFVTRSLRKRLMFSAITGIIRISMIPATAAP